MHAVDVIIDAGIVLCLAVIGAVVWVLYRHGEFDDVYHDVPTQRFTTPLEDELTANGTVVIDAPRAGDLVASAPEDEPDAEDGKPVSRES